nr:GNAT family N-acetyltransferase [Sphingomonas telluris]
MIAEIFFSAIHQIASAHYTRAQVDAWAPAIPDSERFVVRGSDGRTIFVAVDEQDSPIAFGDLEPDGHIDHLFCSPAHAGTGVTATLYDRLEAAGRAAGIDFLYVEASEPARRFFLKRGFQVDHRRDFEIRGVTIHNYRMTKTLHQD